MASSAEIAKRRQSVADLWLRGTPVLRIAKVLEVPHRTVRADVAIIREALQEDRLSELEARRDRSVAVLRLAQREAWSLFHRLADESSYKIGAINSISANEERIAKLEGTWGTEITVNTNAEAAREWADIQQTIAQALMDFPQARIAVASALARMGQKA